ncbi:hypothetical protein [Actinomadura rubrisoli]|uniref:Lipoprotein n=1 Tax=Actinomadura rubrisoli TaxID=2530368 RepID=A0A4R5A6K6_9ACTN|nr:hypothetical protein [Actinomadura rubrisoli]TDD67255.1 hypothetical protein E1298_39570 [Actinomadura rubrisoli]
MKAAVAVLVAAGALAGCGGSPRVGTAALVGDDRITVTTLSQTVRDWRGQFRSDAAANQMRSNSNDPSEQVGAGSGEADMRGALTLLINFRVAEKMAAQQGVPVPDGQTDQVVEGLNKRPGGAASFTLASGLPREKARDVARFIATRQLVLRRLGADGNPASPATAQAGQRWNALFRGTADRMHIKINPRYGTFDAVRGDVGPVGYRLSSPETGVGRP